MFHHMSLRQILPSGMAIPTIVCGRVPSEQQLHGDGLAWQSGMSAARVEK